MVTAAVEPRGLLNISVHPPLVKSTADVVVGIVGELVHKYKLNITISYSSGCASQKSVTTS